MECQLADFERRYGIRERWTHMDSDYCKARQAFLMQKQGQLQSCLWKTVVKRHYLLRAKAKYAGMYDLSCIDLMVYVSKL